MASHACSVVVLGSVNLDLVATVSRLPSPGETVTGATLNRYPGGKGANQALAARRLGAKVYLVANVGRDAAADEALRLVRDEGVDLSYCSIDDSMPTGIALISVADSGENQIVVAPGANRNLRADNLRLPKADALICQLEVPAATLCRAAREFAGFFCVNLAPALEVPAELIQRADLIVMNQTEAAWYGDKVNQCQGFVVETRGAAAAIISKHRRTIADAVPPTVKCVDTVGAGDCFTAALTLALIEGQSPRDALKFACAAGAVATTRPGAQPAMPDRSAVESLLRQSL